MVSLLGAISGLIVSLSLAGFVWWLHRLARSIGHALRRSTVNAGSKRLARLAKLADEGRKILSEPDTTD